MTKKSPYVFDWTDVAFSKSGKKTINDLKATFIAVPRYISKARFAQLIKEYLPSGPIILGLAKEDYVAGFEDQPQFKTLQADDIQIVIDKVNSSNAPYQIYTLAYAQRETTFVFEGLKFQKVLLINGSWKYAFHTQAPYYALLKKATPFQMVSAFASEDEAMQYAATLEREVTDAAMAGLADATPETRFTAEQMLQIAGQASKQSYDYSFQTGVALGRLADDDAYELLGHSFNKVVPYQTYAMHYGAARETNYSVPHDLNHYDTVHAEVEMIIKAQKEGIDLHDTTLFINLMPCPSCARMLAETDIASFVYTVDHSEGYAVQMLQKAGKQVRRLVPPVTIEEGDIQ
jgi:deoxycytidylate deaminase